MGSIKTLTVLVIIFVGYIFAFSISVVHAEDTAKTSIDSLCQEAENNGGQLPSFCDDYTKTDKDKNPVVSTINKVANVIAFIAGAVAIIMVMYGGFQLMTSNGDSGKITKARETILYAAVGLVVIIMARLIVNFAVMVLIK